MWMKMTEFANVDRAVLAHTHTQQWILSWWLVKKFSKLLKSEIRNSFMRLEASGVLRNLVIKVSNNQSRICVVSACLHAYPLHEWLTGAMARNQNNNCIIHTHRHRYLSEYRRVQFNSQSENCIYSYFVAFVWKWDRRMEREREKKESKSNAHRKIHFIRLEIE